MAVSLHVPTAETVNTTDAIWSLIVNQKKSVQKTIASRLSALLEEDKREAQQAYVRESLTSALDEVRQAHSSGKNYLMPDICLTILRLEVRGERLVITDCTDLKEENEDIPEREI